MTALVKNNINNLARQLKMKQSVEFKYNGFFYEVFESADAGYVVNVYSNNKKDEDGEYIKENLIDGGLCTGSARDAVEFML